MQNQRGKGGCCFSLSTSHHLRACLFLSGLVGTCYDVPPYLRNSPCWGSAVSASPPGSCWVRACPLTSCPGTGPLISSATKRRDAPGSTKAHPSSASLAHPDRSPAVVFPLLCRALCVMDGHAFPHIPMGRKWIGNLPLPAMNLFIRLKTGMLGRARQTLIFNNSGHTKFKNRSW